MRRPTSAGSSGFMARLCLPVLMALLSTAAMTVSAQSHGQLLTPTIGIGWVAPTRSLGTVGWVVGFRAQTPAIVAGLDIKPQRWWNVSGRIETIQMFNGSIWGEENLARPPYPVAHCGLVVDRHDTGRAWTATASVLYDPRERGRGLVLEGGMGIRRAGDGERVPPCNPPEGVNAADLPTFFLRKAVATARLAISYDIHIEGRHIRLTAADHIYRGPLPQTQHDLALSVSLLLDGRRHW